MDYYQNAIVLARAALAAQTAAPLNAMFYCVDVNRIPLCGLYESAVASDLIEHLAPSELDILYARVAEHLAPERLFTVHTFTTLD